MESDYPITGDHPAVAALRATFDAARDFGLSDVEVRWAVRDVLVDADEGASVPECIDEISGALARAILAKERYQSSQRAG